jgi:type IV secretory pathway VirB10-like protein
MNILLLLLVASRSCAASGLTKKTPQELGVIMAPDPGRSGDPKAAPMKAPAQDQAATAAAPKATAVESAGGRACPGEDVLFLPTGFTFPALLPDAIYSYNTAAPVIALLEDDVKFRRRIVLPRGTKLVGNASTLHTLDRVNLVWELAVLPEGCEFNISAIGLSADDGSAGIKGKMEKHEDSMAAQIALKGMLSAASVAATAAAPMEGAVAAGFTNEANQNLDQSISKVKSLESIYIHERMPIRIFVLRRFIRAELSH